MSLQCFNIPLGEVEVTDRQIHTNAPPAKITFPLMRLNLPGGTSVNPGFNGAPFT